jgi:uncharacterized membrane protein HdeD (DUF308 family)
MSTIEDRVVGQEVPREPGELRHSGLWFVLLGVALSGVGFIALLAPWIASLATALAIGVLLCVSGVAESIGSFWSRRWSGFFLHMLSGVLSLAVGVLCLWLPVDALLGITLLMACYFLVGGIFKLVAAPTYRLDAWGWILASGLIDTALGVMIWLEWPFAAIWIPGLFVGISLLFRGFNWISLGLILGGQPSAVGKQP